MLYWKALHIIFVVTWFAGLFYIVRLFIYDTEANDKSEDEKRILQQQFKIMQKRLWFGITWPSAILTIVTGTYLVVTMNYYQEFWMQLKIAFVIGLFIYQLYFHKIFKQLQNNIYQFSSAQLRIWNEVATVFLVAIVFLVVLKNTGNFLYGLLGLVIFSALLMLAIKVYKSIRESSGK